MVADTASTPPSSLQRIFGSKLFLAAMLILATILVYLPAFSAGFLWDDDFFLTNNPLMHASDGLYRFWFTTQPPDYFPLTSSMLWLEWRLWGDNATGYHVVNVLLHAFSAVLLWRLLAALRIPGAWLAGLLFAIHPVNVESVAWITERKNTLPMVFYLAALWAYLRFDQTSLRRWYAIALVAFLLGLLSKTSIVMLPVVLLGFACWRHGKLTRQDLLRSIPFFALSLAFGLITVWYQTHIAIGSQIIRTDGMLSRLAVAGCAVWFYLYKAIVPLNLCFVYPRWSLDPRAFVSWLPLLALAGTFIALLVYRKPWTRALRFALGYFVITLLPILGFVDIYFMKFSLVADHWQYFAIIGVIVLVGSGLGAWLHHGRSALRGIIVACLFTGLGALSFDQAQIYTNAETLWNDTLAKNPDCWMAHSNLGQVMNEGGRPREAVPHFQQALRIKPDFAEAHVNWGNAVAMLGQFEESIVHYQEALRFNPNSAETYNNWGNSLRALGRPQEALAHYHQALQLWPNYPQAYNNRGVALQAMGRREEALVAYQEALRMNPDYADAQYNCGLILQGAGRIDEAIAHYQRALQITPDYADAHFTLGLIAAESEKLSDARNHFEQTLRLKPNHADARANLHKIRVLVQEQGGD
jgi:tetratricopeptide (TPR) repeat protein